MSSTKLALELALAARGTAYVAITDPVALIEWLARTSEERRLHWAAQEPEMLADIHSDIQRADAMKPYRLAIVRFTFEYLAAKRIAIETHLISDLANLVMGYDDQ